MPHDPARPLPPQTHADVLHATDTALRLVNQAVGDLGTPPGAASNPGMLVASLTNSRQLASMVLHANTQVAALLERIRVSRGLLASAREAQLAQMSSKFSAVTAATESAATAMIEGLERAIRVVEELEQGSAPDAPPERRARFAALREELFDVMNFIQFQDITSQQLGHASAVLDEAERRLADLASVMSGPAGAERAASATPPAPHPHYDADALADKAESQAFADALFDHR